ncbi:hypothetical protein GY03_11630 [Proteus vulgaris]|uniref:hypothetical protein n=1 Tax=Proteus vulgaris TaxID=585 RepID=UPI0021B0BFAD|nr:hypothetical protein [Proteus vulgaris]MCT6517924.1 hypothetical protein [Proteus vulgaris]
MLLGNIKPISQETPSVLSNYIPDNELYINRYLVLSIKNSSNKLINIKESTEKYIHEIEKSTYINISDKDTCQKEQIYNPGAKTETETEAKTETETGTETEAKTETETKTETESDYVDMDELSIFSEKYKMITKDVMDNELIIDELITDEEIMIYNSHKKLEGIYRNDFDRYFSLIHLINESDDFISLEVKSLLEKEIAILGSFSCELLSVKNKIMESLSELVNNSKFKDKLFQETKEISLKELISKKDKKNYYLTNIFSRLLNGYHKDINYSKIENIKRINDISNAIISLVLAKHDKEDII